MRSQIFWSISSELCIEEFKFSFLKLIIWATFSNGSFLKNSWNKIIPRLQTSTLSSYLYHINSSGAVPKNEMSISNSIFELFCEHFSKPMILVFLFWVSKMFFKVKHLWIIFFLWRWFTPVHICLKISSFSSSLKLRTFVIWSGMLPRETYYKIK